MNKTIIFLILIILIFSNCVKVKNNIEKEIMISRTAKCQLNQICHANNFWSKKYSEKE
jgi:hypothetical protein